MITHDPKIIEGLKILVKYPPNNKEGHFMEVEDDQIYALVKEEDVSLEDRKRLGDLEFFSEGDRWVVFI